MLSLYLDNDFHFVHFFLSMQPLPLTFLLLSSYTVVNAGTFGHNEACNPDNNRLQTGTYQFYSDCNSVNYCDSASRTCQRKKCRTDDFPFGFTNATEFPDKCERGSFCPDEMDACQPWIKVGQPCQKNRDGQSVSALL